MRLINLLKENNIIKVSSSDSLTSVLNKLLTSHDAAFVFKDERFLGVISPYYVLIKNSYPPNTKLIHCLFHPPKIYLNYPLNKVCQLFIESKVHYLPIFDKNDNFLGIISARRVLRHIKDLPIFKIKISDFVKYKRLPVMIFENEKMGSALGLFKKTKISKLIVINKDRQLKGILAYYDLIGLLSQPKIKESRGDRLGEKNSINNLPIKNYFKQQVLTLSLKDELKNAIELILERKIGSVIVLDNNKRPVNIITTQDILKYFIEEQTKYFKQISSEKNKHLSDEETLMDN